MLALAITLCAGDIVDCIASARAALAGTGWPAPNATGLAGRLYSLCVSSRLFCFRGEAFPHFVAKVVNFPDYKATGFFSG